MKKSNLQTKGKIVRFIGTLIINKTSLSFIAVGSLFLLTNIVNAKWELRSNETVELCREFKHYLDRQPSHRYMEGLWPDPLFKGFLLPELMPVKKTDYIHVFVQRRLKTHDSITVNSFLVNNPEFVMENFTEAKFDLFKTKFDINGDSKQEELLIGVGMHSNSDNNRLEKYHIYWPLNREGNFDLHFTNSLGGSPFLFNDRLYLVSITENYMSLTQPSVPWRKDEGAIMGLAICKYNMIDQYQDN